MKKIIIAPATSEERNWTARLIAGSEPWVTLGITTEASLKFCNDPEYSVFIAHHGDDPCGAMVIHPRGLASSPYLKSIVVDKRFRSIGIGQALLEYAEEQYRKTANHFFMCVSSFNPRARALYERLGYSQVGEFPDYILKGQSEILLHKRLK